MRHQASTLIGKGIRSIARLRGGGSALPGLIVEKIDPDFMTRILTTLPHGVVVVSGTNGKTTTTKMVVELLEGQGMRVFTNRTGSNFTRGVAASLLDQIDLRGKLVADIAVLELDEAHAVHFVQKVPPRYALFLNVMRDQLDRFGEIDYTADLLHAVAQATTDTIVINRDDPRLVSSAFVDDLSATIATYGVSEQLLTKLPSDDSMHGTVSANKATASIRHNDIELQRVEGDEISLLYDNTIHTLVMKLKGIYNMQNAAGAIALVRAVMDDAIDDGKMLATLSEVTPAFGRGESITIDNTSCELVLVKNPAGFRLSLASFDATDHATMIAINDDYADGRDMSWLWDVDFNSLDSVEMVSGVRAYDMALRLEYDEVAVDMVDTDLVAALDHFLSTNPTTPKRIFCTYTAMLAIRKALSKYGEVERVL
jgi:UDP-N-acetylmuramyl tripeptide synthase